MRLLRTLRQSVYAQRMPLEARVYRTRELTDFHAARRADYEPIQPGMQWGRAGDAAWFRFEARVPKEFADRPVVALVDVGVEACVFDLFGNPSRGVAHACSSEADWPAAVLQEVPLLIRARGGEKIELMMQAALPCFMDGQASLSAKGRCEHLGHLLRAELATCDSEIRECLVDLESLAFWLDALPPDDPRRRRCEQALRKGLLSPRTGPAAVALVRSLEVAVRGRSDRTTGPGLVAADLIHCDPAGLWTFDEAVRFASQRVASALTCMEKHPSLSAAAGPAWLYARLKSQHPRLYQRLREGAEQRRWDVAAPLWVLPEARLVGAESLVRLLLYGKGFFRREWDLDVRHLWWPDCPLEVASLPQLLRKTGIEVLLTPAPAGLEPSEQPLRPFVWHGWDGSTVTVVPVPSGEFSPRTLRGAGVSSSSAASGDEWSLVGLDDHDGSTGALELQLDRLAWWCRQPDMPRLSTRALRHVCRALHRAAGVTSDPPAAPSHNTRAVVSGWTDRAWFKGKLRSLEWGLREAETLHALVDATRYPGETLRRLWETVLLHQSRWMHVGVMGQSVYQQAERTLRQAFRELNQLILQGEQAWAAQVSQPSAGVGTLVRNPLSWERHEPVLVMTPRSYWCDAAGQPLPTQSVLWHGQAATLVQVRVPSLGHTLMRLCGHPDGGAAGCTHPATAGEHWLENEFLRVAFGADGGITSILDKEVDRELVDARSPANLLLLYEEEAFGHDVSQAGPSPLSRKPQRARLRRVQVQENGPLRASLHFEYEVGRSRIWQTVNLTAGSRRLEFLTHVQWQEDGRVLRAEFPLALKGRVVRRELQFGHLAHPPAHPAPEQVAHRWAAIAEPDYGVALLNDCKYAHTIEPGSLGLTLLRGSRAPDPTADRHTHEFTYALFPHPGDDALPIVQAAAELQAPLRAVAMGQAATAGTLPAEHSWLQVTPAHVMIHAIKLAEEGADLIVRAYEAAGREANATLEFGFDVAAVCRSDLLEHKGRALAVRANRVRLKFRPFEVHTLRVQRP